MTTKTAKIYRFPNATLVNLDGIAKSMVLLEDSAAVPELQGFLSEEASRALGQYSNRIHGATSGELELISSSWTQEVVSYVPQDSSSGIRELSEDEYSKLTPGFQRLYTKKLAEPVETRTVIDHELIAVGYELSEAVLTGKEFPSELHRLVTPARIRASRSSYNYGGNRDAVRVSLPQNLPLQLSSDELLTLVDQLSSQAVPSKGWSASVNRVGFLGNGDLKVTFYEAPYDGSTKKLLDKKKDGHPYADRRGRMVKDLPKIAGTGSVSAADLGSWWTSVAGESLSDSEKLEALKALTKHLWLA